MASEDVIMAGFGGQGLMAIGKILAKSAMAENREVTWIPSYGPEMRGGTANCVVIIDDQPIGSPVLRTNHAAVVMNKQSIDKFESRVAPHGLLIVNTSLIDRRAERADLRVIYIAANEVAEQEGSAKAANMVMLGAYVGALGTTHRETVESVIRKTFADKDAVACETNLRAFRRGFETTAAV